MYYDFNLYEKNVDLLIELLQKNQLDERVNLEPLEKMCTHFQLIHKNYLANERIDHITFMADLSNYGQFCAESISSDLQRINSLLEVYIYYSINLFNESFTKSKNTHTQT